MMRRVSFPLLALLLLLGLWVYVTFIPPPPKICGTPGGPPVTGPRIILRDGRHLSYMEFGVHKDIAKYKVIYIGGHHANKWDSFASSTPDLFEEFQTYIVGFDRPGYGESDPDPKRTIKSIAYDIEELADQLELGPKFYIIGYSTGGALAWGSLKYTPHRLAGAILIAPGISFWWPRLPADLVEEAFFKQDLWMQWNFMLGHYAPWLLYWWNTQDWFPPLNKVINNSEFLDFISNSSYPQDTTQDYSTQQGLYESLIRDFLAEFERWEFEPLDLENPLPNNEGAIELWQGGEDTTVPVPLQRYIVEGLPWIQYHEVPNVGHLFALEYEVKYQIMMSLTKNKTVDSS